MWPFAVIDIQRRGFAPQLPTDGQRSTHQWIAILRIARQNRAFEFGLGIERRAAFEHHHGVGKKTCGESVFLILDWIESRATGAEKSQSRLRLPGHWSPAG